MKKIQFKNNAGFAGADALVAVLILALFSALIATIAYNIYLANSSINRMSKANGYIAEVFEYASKNYYDDITTENLTKYFNNKYYYEENGTTAKKNAEVKIKEKPDEELKTPFKVTLEVIDYNKTEGNTDKLDLVKQIKMTVKYTVGSKEQTLEMSTIKQREKLEVPNRPDITTTPTNKDKKIYPIKKSNGNWVVCDLNDSNWYDYENGNWAKVLVTSNNLQNGAMINIKSLPSGETVYTWIPKYAYKEKEIVFLFENTTKYVKNVDNYNTLAEVDKSYTIPTDFTESGVKSEGIWTANTNLSSYATLNSIYPEKL